MIDDKTPQNFYLGGGLAETIMSPAGALILILGGILIFCLPRKYIVVPALLAMLLIPRGQVLVLGGFHWGPARIVPLFGWLRLVSTRQLVFRKMGGPGLNSIDLAIIGSALFSACAFFLLWLEPAAVFNQVGVLWSSLGVYVMLRSLIQDEFDVYRVIKVLIIVAVISAGAMVYEHITLRNLFGIYIGGVPSAPSFRDGKVRSQGVFAHAILAGTYGATLLPLCLLLFRNTRAKLLGFAGVVASATMAYTSASSTPLLTLFAGILGVCLWPMRASMRRVRWGIVVFLVVAQLLMKAPVWFLIARVDVVGASSGYHRAELVDVFIRHFFDWWLVGTRDAGKWGWEMFDASNQFVSKGESGGLLGFAYFIAVISRCFGRLGDARKSCGVLHRSEWLMWCLGAALFSHVVGFFGISYWDQTEVAWFTLIACISAAATFGAVARGPEKDVVKVEAEDWNEVATAAWTR